MIAILNRTIEAKIKILYKRSILSFSEKTDKIPNIEKRVEAKPKKNG
jgi:hypothetical protein